MTEAVEEEQTDSTTVDEVQQTEGEPETGDGADQEQEQGEASADDDAGATRSKGAERRIRQLTRNYRTEQRERLALQAQVEELKKRIGPPPEPPRPNRDNFDNDEEYEDALFDWRDQKIAATSKATSADKGTAGEDMGTVKPQIVDEFEDELELIAPDAVELVLENEDWKCTPEMTEIIMASDRRAELAYHLATNPDVAEKIAAMSPLLAARELTKVEGKLPSKTKPGASPPPPPANTGKATGSAGVTNPEKLTTAQWVELRRQGKL